MGTPEKLRDGLADALAHCDDRCDLGTDAEIAEAAIQLSRAAWAVLRHLDGDR